MELSIANLSADILLWSKTEAFIQFATSALASMMAFVLPTGRALGAPLQP